MKRASLANCIVVSLSRCSTYILPLHMLHSKLSGKIMPGQWLKSLSQARHSWNSNAEPEFFTRCLSAIKSLLQSSRRDILGSSWPKRCFTSSTPCRVMRPRSLPLMSSVIEVGAFIKIWRCPLNPFSSQFCDGVWLWSLARGQMRPPATSLCKWEGNHFYSTMPMHLFICDSTHYSPNFAELRQVVWIARIELKLSRGLGAKCAKYYRMLPMQCFIYDCTHRCPH